VKEIPITSDGSIRVAHVLEPLSGADLVTGCGHLEEAGGVSGLSAVNLSISFCARHDNQRADVQVECDSRQEVQSDH
jgi:hypothetical protein